MRSLVPIVLCLAACGEDSSGGPYVPIDQIAQAYKDASCKHLVMCGSFRDQASCLAANVPSNFTVDADTVAAVGAGKVYYDGGKLAACFAAIAATTCDRTDADSRGSPDACTGTLFRGALAAGETCGLDVECSSNVCAGTNCGQVNTCCQGTCTPGTPQTVTRAQIGQPCGTNQGCVTTAYCDQSSTCAALKPAGTSCNSPNECDFGLYCAGSPTLTCKPLPTLGQACPDFQCRDEGTICAGSPMAACKAIGLPGDPCTSTSDCSTYYRCDFTTMKCVAYPSIGESCSGINRCNDADSYCDSSTLTCKALGDVGAVCTTSTQCKSGLCDITVNTCAVAPTCT